MKEHWEGGVNIKGLILNAKPKHIVEIGAFEGENTERLKSLMGEVGFKLTVISDDVEMKDDGVTRIRGISFDEIAKLDDNSVDMVLLDTDHNYWTMDKELKSLHPKMTENSYIIMHDVEYFYYATGMSLSYANRAPYPKEEIEKCADEKGGMAMAVINFLSEMRFIYKLIMWVPWDNGICILKRNPSNEVAYRIVAGSHGRGSRKGSHDELA